MDALGIVRAHLVGLSLGGFVVADVIALYLDRALNAVMGGGDLFDGPVPDMPWTSEGLDKRRAEIAVLKRLSILSGNG